MLWQSLSDLTLAGGKRLRPYMCVLGYRAFGGRDSASILNLAAAQELLNAGLLVHDDVIDRDHIRYGRDNISGIYLKNYVKASETDSGAGHYAMSAALLAGDLMISSAHQFITKTNFSAAKKSLAMEIFGATVFEVTGGQLHDMQSATQSLGEVDSIKIARHKTASYSFVGPLSIGAAMAGAPEDMQEKLREYGENAGIAYQLQDDMLGLFGDPASTGKPEVSDLREGKRTFLIQQAFQMADSAGKSTILAALGNPEVSRDELEAVRHIVEQSGAHGYVKKLIEKYAKAAITSLGELRIDAGVKTELSQFVTSSINRQM